MKLYNIHIKHYGNVIPYNYNNENIMPLTKKGSKIIHAMEKEYGKEKGEKVFYASMNKGRIKGVHKGKK